MLCDRCGMEFGDLAPPGTFRHLEPLDCISYLRTELDVAKLSRDRLKDTIALAASHLETRGGHNVPMPSSAYRVLMEVVTDEDIHDWCADSECHKCNAALVGK